MLYLTWEQDLRGCKVARRVHLLENSCHTPLCFLLFAHFRELTTRNRGLFIPLFEPFMRQEVLCHDARDFSEVIEDGEAWILLPLIGWAKPTKLVIGLKRHRRAGLELILCHWARVLEHARTMNALSESSRLLGEVKLQAFRLASIVNELFLDTCASL